MNDTIIAYRTASKTWTVVRVDCVGRHEAIASFGHPLQALRVARALRKAGEGLYCHAVPQRLAA